MAAKDITTTRFVRWSMTVYEEQWHLLANMPPMVKAWGWQDEICPTTGRPHRQGYIHTKQTTFKQLNIFLRGIHLEGIPYGAKGKNGGDRWAGLLAYCKKDETRAPGAVPVQQVNYELPPSQAEALIAIARDLYWQADQREAYLLNMEGLVLPNGLEKRWQMTHYWAAANRIIVRKPHWGPIFARVETQKLWINAHKAYRNLYLISINNDPATQQNHAQASGPQSAKGPHPQGGGTSEQDPK